MDKNNDFLNGVSEAIEKTILHFQGKDFFYYAAPYLSRSKITDECNFFSDNKITISKAERPLEDEELRTISYLAPFFRNRVAYNPKNVDYYLRTIGALSHSESAIKGVLAYHKDYCKDINMAISVESMISLPKRTINISLSNNITAKSQTYIDGLDLLSDKIGMK